MSDAPCSYNKKSRKEWRKLVKKLRRKKIRQKVAIARDLVTEEKDQVGIFNEDASDEIENLRKIRHEKWLNDEEEAQKIWKIKEDARTQLEKEKRLAQERIRKEWESARNKKLEKQKEEERKHIAMLNKIEEYISGSGNVPSELFVFHETNPTKEPCPFFSKVSACRFGPTCSRNHRIPGISKLILISNFYTHFTLNQSRAAEYDTDVGLEFDEREMMKHFREFFDDIVGELETFGRISVVQVCKNSEPHLRGNVYVEYKNERWALNATRSLNARWYGGRQLTVTLALVPDWGAAICGDFHRGRCPKGNECNFLHTFRNPRGCYIPRRKENEQSSRSMRWSESPERIEDRSTRAERRHRSSRHRSRERTKSFTSNKSRRRSRSRTNSDDDQYRNRRRSKSKKENKFVTAKRHKSSTSSNTHLSPCNSSYS